MDIIDVKWIGLRRKASTLVYQLKLKTEQAAL